MLHIDKKGGCNDVDQRYKERFRKYGQDIL